MNIHKWTLKGYGGCDCRVPTSVFKVRKCVSVLLLRKLAVAPYTHTHTHFCPHACVCFSLYMQAQTTYAVIAGSCSVDCELMGESDAHRGIEFVLMAWATARNTDGVY